MKTSELIERLEDLKEKVGDLDVAIPSVDGDEDVEGVLIYCNDNDQPMKILVCDKETLIVLT